MININSGTCQDCGERDQVIYTKCKTCGRFQLLFIPSDFDDEAVARALHHTSLWYMAGSFKGIPLKTTEKLIEVEADSLEKARAEVKSQIPKGFILLFEKIISDGKPKTARAVADTAEAAVAKAQIGIPTDACVLERKVVTAPEYKVIMTDACDEPTARAQVQGQIGDTAVIKALKLIASGKKGFLGMGKTPNHYEADVFQQALAEITHTTKAKISVKVGEKEYEFRNPRYYSNRPVSELKGIILLAPEGEAEQIAKSQVFVGTIEDTVGTWMDGIKTHIIAIGHQKTSELCRKAQLGDQTALEDIVKTGVNSCLEKTQNIFPPGPGQDNNYITRVMTENEVTGSCFIVIFVY